MTRNYKLSDKQLYAIKRLCQMKSGSMPVSSKLPTGAIGKGRRPVINLQTAWSLDEWGLARVNSGSTRITIKPFVRQLVAADWMMAR